MFISTAYAQVTDAAQTQGFDIMSFMPFILLIVVFYFLLIRPQQKKMKEHQTMISNLSRGDKVVTAGGLIGKIQKIGENEEIDLEISSGVTVKVLRSTIQNVMGASSSVKSTIAANAAPKKPQKATKKK